ncbi:MAG: hypothetical protein ACK50A_10580 [Sphingobacteriaceae bacterium]|jgi:hypothetical protein
MKKSMIILFVLFIGQARSQDTLNKSQAFTDKRHEFGVSMLSPFFIITAANDRNERFTNLSYRYRFNQRHALKALVGVVMFDESEERFKQEKVQSVPGKTVYLTAETKIPTNFQTGIGYEMMFGYGKLKHVVGIDLIYNNKFISQDKYYTQVTDTLDANGYKTFSINKLDTGRVIKTSNLDKFGANISYSLRYEISPRWALTGSFILNYRYYERRTNGIMAGISDFNINGLVSDISVFYRF